MFIQLCHHGSSFSKLPGESSERTRQDDFLGARHLPQVAEDRWRCVGLCKDQEGALKQRDLGHKKWGGPMAVMIFVLGLLLISDTHPTD